MQFWVVKKPIQKIKNLSRAHDDQVCIYQVYQQLNITVGFKAYKKQTWYIQQMNNYITFW